MNVLHLISSSGFFGAERVVCELCRCSLTPWGAMSMAVLTRNERLLEGFRKAVIRPEAVVGIRCGGRLDLGAVKELRRLVADWQIDILHSHGYKSDFYAALLKRSCKRPLALVATNHNWIGVTFSEKIYQAIDALVLRNFERVVAVSEQVRQDMAARSIPLEKIEVIGNGIDAEDPDFKIDRATARQVLDLSGDGLVIGNVARLTGEKAHDCLIEAVAALKPVFPNLRLAIVGDGPERPTLEELTRQKQLSGSVRLTGNTDRARWCYAAFDIFALPSHNEGLPMALLEAMAAGVPVVASAVGDVPRVVQHGTNGLLISPGGKDQLVQALRRLIIEPELRRKLSESGRETVRNEYSSRKMAQRYFDLYMDVKYMTA